MRIFLITLFFMAVFMAGTSAFALDIENSDEPETLEAYVAEALATLTPKAPEGALSWDTLGKSEVNYNEDTGRIDAVFPEEVKKLDGTKINILGFLFPLETGVKQTRFLLAALPPSCPFCLPAGPNYIMEVKADEPMPYTEDPIHLEGTLRLLDASDEYQLFYSLENARLKGN